MLTVVLAIIGIWYLAAIWLNAPRLLDQAERQGVDLSGTELVAQAWNQDRPRLATPHQIGENLWATVVETRITSRRSLLYHTWVTLSVTLAAFATGAVFGTLLAVGMVYSRAMDASLMPWVIASQAVPIIALAPMIIVVLSAIGLTGFIPKVVIATYLSFFPVVVGMTKGLRSPDPMQIDQMRTWNATPAQTFWRLRLPASVPFLFTSLKVAIAAALVGTIVGELPTGAVAGLGARLLVGSQYGPQMIIWSALIAAATLAALLIIAVGITDRLVSRAMGARP
ncbi:MAG: ABC transporter permease [Rubricella sp.]